MSVSNNDKEEESTNSPDPLSVIRLAADIKSLLSYHRQLGIDRYPVSPDLSFSCKADKKKPSPPPFVKKPSPKKPGKPLAKIPDITESLGDIYEQINGCRECCAQSRIPHPVPDVVPEQVRLMIVGDYCVEKDEKGVPCLFGREEDKMLAKMIQALGLSRQEVYITNCIKCFCRPEALPGQKHQEQCASFLAREVAAIKPPVICAMGELSARIVLGVNKPLVRLRGAFHRYRYFEQFPVEVMPTFHPRFLLEHQDMKRATWNDLLQVQKRFLDRSPPG